MKHYCLIEDRLEPPVNIASRVIPYATLLGWLYISLLH